ncbi:MAG TPA: methionine synthase [Tepidisphaeraceae bacterium]|nr:methionine synthase [Tepidisphaeraceae bacterium]
MADRLPFLELARRRVVVLDGAMGSNLQTRTLDLQRDWMGHENISEVLNFSRPEVIREIHEAFLDVGCDAVETNSFGANKIVMAEADMLDRVFENNVAAARIAREACNKFETPDNPKYVVGSIGPGTKLITLGQTTWDVMLDSYREQVRGLLAGGVNVLLIETQQDMLAIKCCIAAANEAMAGAGRRVPIIVQASFDTNNGQQMLTGSDASALVATFLPYDEVQVLGLNCALGPYELAESTRYIAENWPRLVSALPNAGLPIMVDGKSHFPMTPPDFTKGMVRFVEEFGVNVVGGCCGTMPEHMKMLVEALRDRTPRRRTIVPKPQVSSLVSAEDIRQDLSYLIIAERTNTNGSRQFKRLLQEENFDGLVSMARDEVRDGSHMLDVCVDFVGRDGVRDMQEVVKRYINSVNVPLMLDSTNPAVMEAGLKLAPGRCVLNSMNLEDGEEKLGQICALAKKYGAAVVAGTIDEDKLNAMARTAERKISIARRICDLAVGKFGLRDEDLLFDPLVLPISTGIEEDRRNALETIEGTRRIAQELPNCHTVVGLSNVSFGLKPAARVVLNSAFLHELREAGLTGAIVHASKILPKNRISDEQWNAALDLIYDRRREGFDPLTHFIALFPDEKTGTGTVSVKSSAYNGLTTEEKLKRHIIDGEKRHLVEHLDEALKTYPALEIINTLLLDGMKTVGELFGSGQMQLPFVLQSAETMKAAVAHLEPHMEKVEGQGKGKIVLATVRGDVHDIGKNLVDIILTNNGYTVYNLGIKQPISDILCACEQHKAHAIGMSGLLVKSVAVMKENLEELNAKQVTVPVLLGGAALTRDYAEDDLATLYQGPLLYCRDAFEGLHMMDAISGGKTAAIVAEQRERSQKRKRLRTSAVKPKSLDAAGEHKVDQTNPVPLPPFWGRRVVTDLSPKHLFPFINENALFRGQWGFKQGKLSPDEFQKLTEETARPVFEALKKRALGEGFLEPKVVYGYFPVQAEGDDLIVYHTEPFEPLAAEGERAIRPNGPPREWLRFRFPRQDGRRRLCISDFFRPRSSNQFDVLGVQLVTVGNRATELAEALRKDNKYQDYLYLHGFGVESAEALAELWHKRMRQELGFGSEDAPTTREIFQQGYRGSRYSFGYPACPNLEDRALIAELLRPEEIGVTLSENFMLVPEQSTDAIVAHHPQAKYFDV